MSKKSDEAYQEFIKETQAKLGPADREHFDALVNSEGGKALFGGALTERRLYQGLNEVTAKEKEIEKATKDLEAAKVQYDRDVAAIDEWFRKEEPVKSKLRAERDALQSTVETYREHLKSMGLEDEVAPAAGKNINRGSDGSLEELKEAVNQLTRQVRMYDIAIPKIVGDSLSVAHRMTKDGFEVDSQKLIDHSKTKGVDLVRSYEDLTAEFRAKKQAEDLDKEREKWREEGRREALSKFPSPDRIRPSSVFASPEAPKNDIITNLVDRTNAAAAEYRKEIEANPTGSGWLPVT